MHQPRFQRRYDHRQQQPDRDAREVEPQWIRLAFGEIAWHRVMVPRKSENAGHVRNSSGRIQCNRNPNVNGISAGTFCRIRSFFVGRQRRPTGSPRGCRFRPSGAMGRRSQPVGQGFPRMTLWVGYGRWESVLLRQSPTRKSHTLVWVGPVMRTFLVAENRVFESHRD
jgi:hypothetical protein